MHQLHKRLAVALAVLAAVPMATARAALPDTVAFVNVSVLPMDRERTLERQTVVVTGDRIVRVGPATEVDVPDGATRVDGAGKFLLPGLNEMHGHLPNEPEAARDVLALFVANGVTSVRGMLGHPYHLQLREAVRSGDVTGPTLVLSGPAMGGNIVTPETGARLVREYEAAGYDLLKVHEGLSLATYDAIVAAAKQAELPFAGHVSDHVGLEHALEAGQSTIDHLDNYVQAAQSSGGTGSTASPSSASDAGLLAIVEATRRSGAGVVPTMALWQVLVSPPPADELRSRLELRYVSAEQVEQWAQQVEGIRANVSPDAPFVLEFRDRVLAALQDAGVPVLLGSDAPQLFSVPGFSLQRELAAMTAAGLTPYEALEAGTRLPAEHLGVGNAVGTVAEGKRADLILLDGDPLGDLGQLSDPAGVVLRGRWLPREALREMLAEVERRAASAS